MKEKNFYPLFNKLNKVFGVFEIKLCKKKSFPFKALEEHQIKALLDISGNKGLSYKIPDGWNRYGGMAVSPKPFDLFNLRRIDAYIILIFYVPRKKKIFYYIRIIDFLSAKARSKRKSLTEEACAKIAIKTEKA